MKKIIIILWAMLMNCFAYGQESLQERLKSNPVVDSLFAYARTIGIEPVEKYEYDGEYMNTMKFDFYYKKAAEKPKDGEEIIPDIIRKTKCSEKIKRSVPPCKTKCSFFGFPPPCKKRSKKFFILGCFFIANICLYHVFSVTLHQIS